MPEILKNLGTHKLVFWISMNFIFGEDTNKWQVVICGIFVWKGTVKWQIDNFSELFKCEM